MAPSSCPHWEIDPHQIFPWVQVCRWFMGCSGCRLDEIGVCKYQGLQTEEFPEESDYDHTRKMPTL